MLWIKAHLTVVVVAAISLVSVIMLVLGVVLSNVGGELTRDAQVFSGLRGLKPVNEQAINQARDDAKKISQQLDTFLRPYRDTTQRTPLMEEVFAADKPLDVNPAWRFQKLYSQAQRDLLEQALQASDAPSSAEVQAYAEALKHEQDKADRERGLGLTNQPAKGAQGGYGAGQRPVPGSVGSTYQRSSGAEKDQTALEYSIMRARQIRCYASLESLDLRPETTDSRLAPSVEDMWYAQVALWLQQDVLKALANLNDEAAKQLEQAGEKGWVGNLPVKHLVRIRMGNYVPAVTSSSDSGGGGSSGSSTGSQGEADLLPGRAGMVFTLRGSKGNVDVVHFYAILVIEAARLQQVINAVSGSGCGFCTPLNVSYEVEPAEDSLAKGCVYGTAPTIRVTLVCEACMLRSSYEKWIPKTVADAIKDGTAAGAAGGHGAASPTPSSGGSGRPRSSAPPGPASPLPKPSGGRRIIDPGS